MLWTRSHTSTVEAFYHQFQAIKALLVASQPEIPESYFASRFVYSLNEEFQSFIFRFQPRTITAAYRLACIYEESIYLQYFPELACQQVDLSKENKVIENNIVVLGVERDSEVIMGEDLSSECKFVVDNTGSNQGKEDIIDTLVDGSVVLYPNQDTPDSLKVTADQNLDNVSSRMAYQQSMSLGESDPMGSYGTLVQLPVVRRVSAEEELELLVIKEAKVHPPDLTVTFVDSDGYLEVYALRKNSGGDDIIAVIFTGVSAWLRTGVRNHCENVKLIESIAANFTCVIHFRFNWEPGPLASQWRVNSVWRSYGRKQGFLFLVCSVPDIVKCVSKAILARYSSEPRSPRTAKAMSASNHVRLYYFPEDELPSDEYYGEMIATNNRLEFGDGSQADQVEEDAVGKLNISSAMKYLYVDGLGGQVRNLIAVGHMSNQVEFTSCPLVIYTVPTAEVLLGSSSWEYVPLLVLKHNYGLSLSKIDDTKVHPPDRYFASVDFSMYPKFFIFLWHDRRGLHQLNRSDGTATANKLQCLDVGGLTAMLVTKVECLDEQFFKSGMGLNLSGSECSDLNAVCTVLLVILNIPCATIVGLAHSLLFGTARPEDSLVEMFMMFRSYFDPGIVYVTAGDADPEILRQHKINVICIFYPKLMYLTSGLLQGPGVTNDIIAECEMVLGSLSTVLVFITSLEWSIQIVHISSYTGTEVIVVGQQHLTTEFQSIIFLTGSYTGNQGSKYEGRQGAIHRTSAQSLVSLVLQGMSRALEESWQHLSWHNKTNSLPELASQQFLFRGQSVCVMQIEKFFIILRVWGFAYGDTDDFEPALSGFVLEPCVYAMHYVLVRMSGELAASIPFLGQFSIILVSTLCITAKSRFPLLATVRLSRQYIVLSLTVTYRGMWLFDPGIDCSLRMYFKLFIANYEWPGSLQELTEYSLGRGTYRHESINVVLISLGFSLVSSCRLFKCKAATVNEFLCKTFRHSEFTSTIRLNYPSIGDRRDPKPSPTYSLNLLCAYYLIFWALVCALPQIFLRKGRRECTTNKSAPPRPAQLDNHHRVEIEHRGDDLQKLRTTQAGIDYVLVLQDVWKKSHDWYKGGPALTKTVIPHGIQIMPTVEVHLLQLQVSDSKDETVYIIFRNTKASLHHLYSEVKKLLGLEAEKLFIWESWYIGYKTQVPKFHFLILMMDTSVYCWIFDLGILRILVTLFIDAKWCYDTKLDVANLDYIFRIQFSWIELLPSSAAQGFHIILLGLSRFGSLALILCLLIISTQRTCRFIRRCFFSRDP